MHYFTEKHPINFENMNVIQNCIIIELPKIQDPRGNLSFIEGKNHFPFEINSAYWIYDVRNGKIPGGHAFKQQNEMIIALSGSLDVVVDDGTNRKIYSLNRSYYGLYIPSGIWYQMENFSTNSLILVLSSGLYFEKD
jgi:dTDP-4-dehydrorhamnose 3,5-epimerase-like enzyme